MTLCLIPGCRLSINQLISASNTALSTQMTRKRSFSEVTCNLSVWGRAVGSLEGAVTSLIPFHLPACTKRITFMKLSF